MRQRALQKKLDKVQAAQAANNEAADGEAPAESAAPAEETKMTAKALARQRLLKKKQLEAAKKAGNDTAESEANADSEETKRLAEEANRRQEENKEEEAKRRAEEESRKLREAKCEGAMKTLEVAMKKILDHQLNATVVSWVENFGDALVLMELAEEELEAEQEAAKELLEEGEMNEEEVEEALDEGLEMLADMVTEEDVSIGDEEELSMEEMKARFAKLKETNASLQSQLSAEKKKAKESHKLFLETNQELAGVQRALLEAKNGASSSKGSPPGSRESTGSRRKSSKTSHQPKTELDQVEALLAAANKDLAEAQKDVMAYKVEIQKLKKQVGQKGGAAPSPASDPEEGSTEWMKLKQSYSTVNKELSEAQYVILAKREHFTEIHQQLETLVTGSAPLIDLATCDKKIKKVLKNIDEILDQALEDEETHRH